MPKKKKIAFIEDEVNLLDSVKNYLEGVDEGSYSVDCFKDASAFINSCIDLSGLDAIVSDIHFPEGMDGIELLKIVKSIDSGRYSDIPFITVSGVFGPFDVIDFADDFIQKPFRMDELHEKLEKDIGKYREIQECRNMNDSFEYRDAGDYILLSKTSILGGLRDHLQNRLRLYVSEKEGNSIINAVDEAVANKVIHGNYGLGSRKDDPEWDEKIKKFREAAEIPLSERLEHEEYTAYYEKIDRKVRLRFYLSEKLIAFTVTDQGDAFDWKGTYERNNALISDQMAFFDFMRQPDQTGRGLLMIQKRMHEVYFNESGNEITMVYKPEAS